MNRARLCVVARRGAGTGGQNAPPRDPSIVGEFQYPGRTAQAVTSMQQGVGEVNWG